MKAYARQPVKMGQHCLDSSHMDNNMGQHFTLGAVVPEIKYGQHVLRAE